MTVSEREARDESSDDPPMIRIHPEPMANELAAIVAAVSAALASVEVDEPSSPPPSRWGRAGRAEALRAPLRPGAGEARSVLTGPDHNVY